MRKAFTMAEVLITIGIIGIVAAMTLPTLINNSQNKEFEEGLKRSYSILSQALEMYYAQNGERITPEIVGYHELKTILMQYLNVVQDCGYGNSDADSSCIPNSKSVTDSNKEYIQYRTYNNKADVYMSNFDDGQFVLNDGSLILLNNYANAQDDTLYISVDLNGFHKNPNRLGADLFMFQIDEKGKLLPMGAEGTKYYSATNEFCSPTSTSTNNGAGCTYNALTDKTFFRKKH